MESARISTLQKRPARWLGYGGLVLLCFGLSARLAQWEYNDFAPHYALGQHFGADFLGINFVLYLLAAAVDLLVPNTATGLVLFMACIAAIHGFKAQGLHRFLAAGPQPLVGTRHTVLWIGCLLATTVILPHDMGKWETPFRNGFFESLFLYRPQLTVWHNATYLLLLPVAIWVFCRTLAHLQATQPPARTDGRLLAAVALSVLIKPSFCFVLLPGVASLLLVQAWQLGGLAPLWRRHRALLLAMVAGAALIAVQYLTVFVYGSPFDTLLYQGETSRLAVGLNRLFFEAKNPHAYSGLLLLSSALFSGYVLVRHGRSAWQDPAIRLSFWMYLFGMLIMLFVYEQGSRFDHANFLWQAHLGSSFLFWSTTRYYGTRARHWWAPGWFVWALQLISGLVLIALIVATGQYN